MRIYIIPIVTILFTACSPVSTPLSTQNEMQPIPNTPKGKIPLMTPTTSTPSDAPGMPNLIENTKRDLAQMLNISESEINILEAKDVVWPNSSLGCPQPGTTYTQVLTDGFLIRLEVDGNIYEYHTDADKQIIFCKFPELPIIPVTPGEIDDGMPWMPVD